ncbi:MAG: hypothetical protein JWO65_1841, partial [Sphingomonas bacterium]|nr:hypothetical protein [Sphingomonas bacterium]
GVIREATGSYLPAFLFAGLLGIAAAVAMLAVRLGTVAPTPQPAG